MRLPLLTALLATACTSATPVEIPAEEMDAKADGLASKLKLVDHHRMDIDEPSDLAFSDGKLYTVSDSHSKIYEIDNDGDVQDVVDVQGTDLEAIAIDDEDRFYIADESKQKIWRVNHDGDRKESIEVDTSDSNSGIEGLAFDNDGHLFVANEKDPARIITLDAGDGEELDRKKLDFLPDLSALAWNPDDEHLYALSDEAHRLYRLDSDFHKVTVWKLPIENPEGLAFDGSTVYVASDAENRLYVFELE
jgi:uncharacterized protein YjiK